MAKYVFCFPYRGVGGVPVLFTRIARRIVQSGEHQALVVDYPDGAMARAVEGSPVQLIAYHDDLPVPLPADAIVVFQSLNPWAMYRSLHIPGRARIFFWNCHPFNLVPVFPGLRGVLMSRPRLGRVVLATLLRRYRNIVVRLIDFLLARNALAFMDKTNVENTEQYLGLSLPPQDYLPVPADETCPRIVREPRDWRRDGLRLAWIGRIADFKYPILSKTLAELDRTLPALGVPASFTIVGGGEHMDDLLRDIARLKHLTVHLAGELPAAEIAGFLSGRTDILFGMGVSALEGVRLGVPTVLLDVAYGAVPDGYVFTWMHDRVGYTLGEVLSAAQIRPGNATLTTLLQQAMADYDGVSRAAHAYYARAHAPAGVMEKFLRVTQLSTCFYEDYSKAGFAARDPVYEFFAAFRKRVM